MKQTREAATLSAQGKRVITALLAAHAANVTRLTNAA
jgi:hypothetical protein